MFSSFKESAQKMSIFLDDCMMGSVGSIVFEFELLIHYLCKWAFPSV